MLTLVISPTAVRGTAGNASAAVSELLSRLHPERDLPGVWRPFEPLSLQGRRGGDDEERPLAACGVLDRADVAVGLMLSVGREARWSVGLGVVASPCTRGGEAGRAAALRALRRSASAPGRVAVEMADSADLDRHEVIEASLQLLLELEQRRSADGQAAGALVDRGRTQLEASVELGVSQQAVSARLRTGLWHESRRLAAASAQLLQELLDSGG